jgi:hypothetical protein
VTLSSRSFEGHVGRVRHRRDAGGIDAAHVLDQAEDAGQFAEHFLGLGLGDCDAREVRHALYVFDFQRHGRVGMERGGGETRIAPMADSRSRTRPTRCPFHSEN